jgi:acid phosphatase type 7
MSFRSLAVATLCLACIQCGSQTPSAPTPVASPPSEPTPVDPLAITPPTGGTTEIFVGAGDIANCDPNAEATARLLDSIGGTVFTLGDNAYPKGSEQNFRDCYDPTWGRHKSRTRPAPGNHDYETAGAAPYFNYFGPNAGPPGVGYYSFELGSWLVLSLNSNVGIPAQVTWMKNLLSRSKARCTIAYWHHPLYSSGPNSKMAGIREWWQVLYDAGAEIVLSAHDHLYERFAPQDDLGHLDPERGIRGFVVGTGGGQLYATNDRTPNSEVLISSHGVLKLTLASDRYEWEFIPVSGQRDSGSGRCH